MARKILTALAFPPTCIHLSWYQLQLESNSVDLCARATCHSPADTSRHFPSRPIHTYHSIWGCSRHPGNITQPPPCLLRSTLSMKALLFIYLVNRVLIISRVRKEVEFSGTQAWIWLSP